MTFQVTTGRSTTLPDEKMHEILKLTKAALGMESDITKSQLLRTLRKYKRKQEKEKEKDTPRSTPACKNPVSGSKKSPEGTGSSHFSSPTSHLKDQFMRHETSSSPKRRLSGVVFFNNLREDHASKCREQVIEDVRFEKKQANRKVRIQVSGMK